MFGASKSGKLPGTPDPQFNYVTALLHGDGTNGAQNNTFLDSSTNNATITRTGTPTQGSFSPYGSLWSNYFNGSTDYFVSSTSLLAYSVANKNTDVFTFEAWVYITATKTVGSTFQSQSMLAKGNVYINWGIDSSNQLLLYSYATGVHAFSSTTAISLNTWTHVATTVSGGTITHYINGVASGTGTWYGSDDTTDISTIGHAPAVSAAFLQGYISNLRVTNALVYSSSFTPSKTPLTAITNTQLLTCQNNRFIDNSANAYALTPTGSPSVQRFNPFLPTYSQAYSTSVYGGSGYFDGSGNYLTSSSVSLSGDFTVEGWIYHSDNSVNLGPICIGDISTTSGLYLYISTGNVLYLYLNGVQNFTGVTNAQLGSWIHLATVRVGTTVTVYVNGVNVYTVTGVLTITGATYIGSSNFSGTFYGTKGFISDVRVTNNAVYTANFTPPTAPLTAISGTSYLVSMTNGAIYDNAMMNDLVTVGSAQISTSVKKYGTGSLAFDGTGDYIFGGAFSSPIHVIGGGNFTVESWLYTNTNKTQIIFDTGTTSGSTTNLQLLLNATGYPIFYITNTIVLTSSIAVSTTTWTHVAWVRNNGTITIYVNGVSGGSTSNTTNMTDTGLTIGTPNDYRDTSSTYHFDGYMDDFRITTGYARYTTTFTPPTTALPNYGS